MSASLHDRLRRLKRGPERGAAGASAGANDLEQLEHTLLGEIEHGLPLKQRLERLVSAVAKGGRQERHWPAPNPLEDLVSGAMVKNERGSFFLVEQDLHLETLHGEVSLSRFRAVSDGSVAILTGEPRLSRFDFRRAVFLDTETTGLSGGTGTAAFLVGIGFLDEDRFRLRQYVMRDYDEEAALLHGLAEDLHGFTHLVTFNGRQFDVPLLETRYRLNRSRFPLAQAPHLDMLTPARRLWKERLVSCRLQSLEAELLGVRRRGDVSGDEIPRIYFEYVRSRDGRRLAGVLDHNRLDLISLAALTVLACEWVEEDRACDARDLYSLGRVFERASLHDRAEEQYQRVLGCDEASVRVPSLLRLADRARRRGEHGLAAEFWEDAAQEGDVRALRQLAIHHERRGRDLASALSAVERGLSAAHGWDGAHSRVVQDLHQRRRRLLKKIARRAR